MPEENTDKPVISWPLDPVTQQSLRRWLGDEPEQSSVVALTDASTVTTNALFGDIFTLTTTQNFTMANPTNAVNGKKIIYKIKQDGTGSRVITWGSDFRGSTDIPLPTLTTTANYVDYVGFIYDSAVSKWNCLAVTKGFAT
jgi:hypothetical protein